MKHAVASLIFLLIFSGSIPAAESSTNALAPTGLTLVVSDSTGLILDCVSVENDQKSRLVTFSVPENAERIRVFALGTRIRKEFPADRHFTGLAADKKHFGLGVVRLYVKKGILVNVDCNGFGSLSITDAMKSAIQKDLEEAKPAAISRVELVED